MSLRDRLKADVSAAMRSGESLRRDVLRMAQNAVDLAEKRDRRPYTDDEVVGILTREVKTRRESVEAFRAGGREDLAAKEQAEIEIISAFLPTPLTPAELDALVAQAVAETGAGSPRDLGKVMGWLSPRTRGRADGKQVSGLVNEALADLPKQQRLSLALYYLEGLSVAETAAALELSEGAVKYHLHQGRERLRGLIGEGGA